MSAVCSLRFFFFQAEDGIRDKLVTGVQTCALPISPNMATYGRLEGAPRERAPSAPLVVAAASGALMMVRREEFLGLGGRSEERRVGKEWRSRWSPRRYNKNMGEHGLPGEPACDEPR